MENSIFDVLKAELIDKLDEYKYNYDEIETLDELKKVHNLFCKDIFEEPLTATEIRYFGFYYGEIKEDYDKMKQYYLLAIKYGDACSIYNLGRFYESKKDYQKMKIYYKKAMEAGFECYPELSLAYHYFTIKNKLTKSLYYYVLCKKEEYLVILDEIIANKIPLDDYFYRSLPGIKTDNLHPLLKAFISLYLKNIDVLESSYLYSPGEKGYEEAKEDFHQRLINV
jgi:TPR repeat protein